jgi:beta-1,4-N-acetylglucosaminyltransferase
MDRIISLFILYRNSMSGFPQVLLSLAIVFTIVRVVWFMFGRHLTGGLMFRHKYKFLVVLGSGGHTSEMLLMLKQFKDKYDRIEFHFVVAESDTTSVARIAPALGENVPYSVIKTPRLRHVGESFITAILKLPKLLLINILLVLRIDPDVLIVNGPGTCIPSVFGACVVQIFSLNFKRIFCVFVESFCRVKTLSLTGKLLYPFVDKFIVQWEPTPEMTRRFPRIIYKGPVL